MGSVVLLAAVTLMAVTAIPGSLAAWNDEVTVAAGTYRAYEVKSPTGPVGCTRGSDETVNLSWAATPDVPAGHQYQVRVSWRYLGRDYDWSTLASANRLLLRKSDTGIQGAYIGSPTVTVSGIVGDGGWASRTSIERDVSAGWFHFGC